MQHNKRMMKYLLYLCIIGMVFVSCEKELYEETFYQEEIKKDFKVKSISFDEFNEKFEPSIKTPVLERQMISFETSKLQGKSSDSTSEFIIYTDKVMEITQGDYTSYTMNMKTPYTDENMFYNITFEERQDSISVFITKYSASNNWLSNQSGSFEGQINTYRIGENLISGSSIKLMEYSQLFDLINGNEIGNGGGSGGSFTYSSSTYPWDCTGFIHIIYILEPVKCSEDIHWPWNTNCTADIKGHYIYIPQYECVTNNSNPVDNIPPIDDYNDFGSGNGSGVGISTGNSSNSNNQSLTTIVFPIEDEEKKTPCEELAENDSISDFSTKMAELKTKAGTQNFESAYAIYQNAVDGLILGDEFTGQSNANGEGREVNLSLNSSITANAINCVGFIHCHLDDGTTFKVFSLDDIIALALIAETSTRPTSEFAIYVTTNSGTLALKVNNKILLASKIETIYFTYNKQEEKFSEFVTKTKTYDKQKLGLVKFLNNMPFIGNPGIEVYEKVGSTWNKIDISTNGNSITSTPCN